MAKIDMFDGKVNNASNGEKKLNTWYGEFYVNMDAIGDMTFTYYEYL